MRLAVRAGLVFVVATFVLAALVVAGGGSVEVMAALVLVTLLLLRGVVAARAPEALRVRIGVFVFLAAAAFTLTVVQRIREVLSL